MNYILFYAIFLLIVSIITLLKYARSSTNKTPGSTSLVLLGILAAILFTVLALIF